MSKTDSVSGEIHNHYEETVRKSLKSILWSAFSVNCRESMEGYNRSFFKVENPGNLWWANKPDDKKVQIDFLAHVTPLDCISDVNESLVAKIPNVSVWKSTAEASVVSSNSIVPGSQQNKSSSPEKSEAIVGDDAPYEPIDEHFQYAIAEIASGGQTSVLGKLVQLEKDCFFLCSRACPTISDEANFKVLETIAFVAVVSPNPCVSEIFKKVKNATSSYPLLRQLFNQGRFVCIQHKETLVVVIQDLGSKMQNLETKLTEQSQTMQELENNLTEQNQAMKSQLSEQNQTIKELTNQLTLLHQILLSRLPVSK